MRRSLKCFIKQDENQIAYPQKQNVKITNEEDTVLKEGQEDVLNTDEGNPVQEKRIISMRWLTMTLNIMKLEKYVETCRMLKKKPDPTILNASCRCILTMQKDLISYHPDFTKKIVWV